MQQWFICNMKLKLMWEELVRNLDWSIHLFETSIHETNGNSFGLKIRERARVTRTKIQNGRGKSWRSKLFDQIEGVGLDQSPIKGIDQGTCYCWNANWTFAHVLFHTTWKLFVVQKCAKIWKALVQIVSHWFSHNLIDRLTKRGWTVYSVSLLKAKKLKNRGDLSKELRNDNRDEPSEFKLKRFYD